MFRILFLKLRLFILNLLRNGVHEASTKDVTLITKSLAEEINLNKYVTDRDFIYRLHTRKELQLKELSVKARGRTSINVLVCETNNNKLISTLEILVLEKNERNREHLFNKVDASIYASGFSPIKEYDRDIRDIMENDRFLFSFLMFIFGKSIEEIAYRKIYKSTQNPKSYAIVDIDTHIDVSQAIVTTLMVQLE